MYLLEGKNAVRRSLGLGHGKMIAGLVIFIGGQTRVQWSTAVTTEMLFITFITSYKQ